MSMTTSLPLSAFTPVVSATVSAVLSWFACALVLTALCNRFLPWPKGCRDNSLIFSGLVLLMMLPIGGHPGLAAGLLGILGTPSGTLFQLSVLTCLNRAWPSLPSGRWIWISILLILSFYAFALGYGKTFMPDIYEQGFSPSLLWLLLTITAYLLYRYQQTGWIIVLTINLVIWRTGLFPSRNLWDVLFDPMLLAVLLWHGVRKTPSSEGQVETGPHLE